MFFFCNSVSFYFFLYQLFYSLGGVGVRQPSSQLLILVLTKRFNSKFTHAIIVNFLGDCLIVLRLSYIVKLVLFLSLILTIFFYNSKTVKGGNYVLGTHIATLQRLVPFYAIQ